MVKRRVHHFRWLGYAGIFLIGLLGLSVSAMAAVNAQVDRTTINENETLTLTISMSDGDKGQPDIAALGRDFSVVSRSQSSSYSFVNGKTSSEKKLTVVLQPKRAGRLTIPAFKTGTASTQPISVQVNKAGIGQPSGGQASRDQTLWIDMQLAQPKVYVQQQALLTVRVYRSVVLAQASLTDPIVDQMQIQKIGKDRDFQVTRAGQVWQVIERKYALFPQQSGEFDIEPVQLDGSVSVGRPSLFFQNSRPVRARSNAVHLKVMPIPPQWKQGIWLPAQRLQLREHWSGEDFRVGESITRTVELLADGLMSNQLPELSVWRNDATMQRHIKTYTDTPELVDQNKEDRWQSMRREKTAMIPSMEGDYTLPAIEIPWWNINTETVEVAVIPAKTIHVERAAATASLPGTIVPQPLSSIKQTSGEAPLWKWVALASLGGWLGTLFLILISRRTNRSAKPQTTEPQHRKPNHAKKAVLKACRNNDARACEKALLAFARQQWPDAGVNGLQAVAVLCQGALHDEIVCLEQYLYAPQSGTETVWSGAGLSQAFRRARFNKNGVDKAASVKKIPDLYPS